MTRTGLVQVTSDWMATPAGGLDQRNWHPQHLQLQRRDGDHLSEGRPWGWGVACPPGCIPLMGATRSWMSRRSSAAFTRGL